MHALVHTSQWRLKRRSLELEAFAGREVSGCRAASVRALRRQFRCLSGRVVDVHAQKHPAQSLSTQRHRTVWSRPGSPRRTLLRGPAALVGSVHLGLHRRRPSRDVSPVSQLANQPTIAHLTNPNLLCVLPALSLSPPSLKKKSIY